MQIEFPTPLLLIVLLYAGPDQLLPLASILGTIIGILLIGWQRVVGFMRTAYASVVQRLRPSRGK